MSANRVAPAGYLKSFVGLSGTGVLLGLFWIWAVVFTLSRGDSPIRDYVARSEYLGYLLMAVLIATCAIHRKRVWRAIYHIIAPFIALYGWDAFPLGYAIFHGSPGEIAYFETWSKVADALLVASCAFFVAAMVPLILSQRKVVASG